ncbi:MAG: aminoglycoside phosphotransferase [Gallionellales bacterium RIFCSPHIGHO2_02_FULL_57_16]|nr:MAG: aminoglycoside phosphotransferase [Gallionellales bacterium RIFCSPHIGHO2_02_FULL_57_16]
MTHEAAHLPPMIRALLCDPGCYDHAVGKVQLAETHISWVLLTGDYAYKLKKPVNLGFLDFSTLALRQQACADEVRLNRRLAPDYYLGVVAITGSAAAPRINGQGEAFEYAVKMRQFPPDATLDRIDARGELGVVQIDQLAARLAQFHLGGCPVAPANSLWGEPDTIARPVTENFQLVHERLDGTAEIRLLESLQNWSDAEHQRLTPLMRERKKNGMVRECHGDLHLGNLAWAGGQLIIFDCIEFSPALRWIDVISEVAFCYMDLLHRQHRDLAFRFLNAWLEATSDYGGMALLRYYTVYRAMVRAKVAAIRAGQETGAAAQASRAEVSGWLHLAERLTQIAPPQLRITHGLSGSGKTTQSQLLLQEQGMVRLRSDVERKRLAGMAVSSDSGSSIETGLYTQDASRRTYAHLARLAESLLDAGWPVIVDAAFLKHWQRDLFRDIAMRRSVQFRILDIQADPATLHERIRLRTAQGKDASEADLRVLQHQIETEEPLDSDELALASQLSVN